MENTAKSINLISEVHSLVEDGQLSNDNLLELIKVAGAYLNLQTIPNYAKERGLTYQGVKVTRKIVEIFNVKFVVDND